ncbi:poly(A) RNA polymerase CID14-like [Bidens hawaiensis]|uniref:poly(A) RNA polymerase CID14-like n=1 Tax=Bidens hawaiensis TaxID=980011 RepID=UPI00404A4886
MQNTTSSVTMPDSNLIPAENWAAVEAPIRRILKFVRPTYESENHRNNVVWYIRQLIQNRVGWVQVLPYGSGPLRTYLPDGDIDLTVVSDIECDLLCVVFGALQAEIHIHNGQGMLKEAQCIDAKVKLIKCVVDGVGVDISFNQKSGLYALCFLDRVDLYMRKDHLFKRSIILIKSWCYHESRLMGAGRGLISTYALETLVLSIFSMYNTSLNRPLMVLYRFLEYYSKFEWNKFAVSINGPVELLLLPFRCNVVNIIDPLKPSNNLGTSVHSGMLFHITIALDRGARMLRKILEL